MKKIVLFLFVMLFCIATTFAQNVIADVHAESFGLWDSIKSIFFPAIFAQVLVLFADAKKHYDTDGWSWSIFIDTKLKPFLLTTILGIVIYIILIYIPFSEPFLNILAGTETLPLTSAALFGAAVAIIDGFTKKKK